MTIPMRIKPYIMSNPSIFEYDYDEMKRNMAVLAEELMAKAWHPSRVIQWIENETDEMLE